jgi:transcription termination factor Rho
LTDIAEVTSAAPEAGAGRKRRGSGLDGMVLPELKQLAGTLGLKGTGAMRKSQLIDAIQAAQTSSSGSRPSSPPPVRTDEVAAALDTLQRQPRPAEGQPTLPATDGAPAEPRSERDERPADQGDGERSEAREGRSERRERRSGREQNGREQNGRDQGNREQGNREGGREQGNREQGGREQSRDQNGRDQGGREQAPAREQQPTQNQPSQGNRDRDWDDDGGRRGRRRRSRDRQNRRGRTGGGGGNLERFEPEPVVNDDDVLVPARGILDVLDNYAFVRTSGYLPGSEDAYVSLSMVKKFGLRKGDVVTGVIRASGDGERKEKFNPLVRLETVNGLDPEQVRQRPEFNKLVPLYPQERLKMETTPNNLTGRIIDLICPVGKGQRGLIVSPSKSGKTMIMQSIANSITANNPETHLMVVLVDERPEEVTDFQRAVQGEVIASTFDRPASDHTIVAELAIERAKRLVEVGKDVVVLLDGITRLGRAYNIAAPASGRILSGGVDSAALYPPKKFFGAARNIEGGGSLTILATALIETGSKMDEVIFEEFKGTGNMELRLRREFSDKRIFPAIDVDASSTRREELLMSREELNIVWKLRRVIGGLDNLQGLEMLLDRLRKTNSNNEFLMAITKSIPA